MAACPEHVTLCEVFATVLENYFSALNHRSTDKLKKETNLLYS